MSTRKDPKQISQATLLRVFSDAEKNQSKEVRFCFLIGAGASKSSGIPTGYELAKDWYEELKEDLTQEELDSWTSGIDGFDEERLGEFYTQLYKKRFEASPQSGYDLFTQLMEHAQPNFGYVILAEILAKGRHNFVITTNFDYLIEDSVRFYSNKKPFVAGHETLAEFISSQSERPTIIKVHRDLFLHPFNSQEETEALKEQWKKALSQILQHFHLLVIGYGGNDGSLMGYLQEIPQENRKSIYWCKRKEGRLNSMVGNLLGEKDYVVDIKSFDNLMDDLYEIFGLSTFDHLDDLENHPFVLNAKERIKRLKEKIQEILTTDSKMKTRSLNDHDNIYQGVFKIIHNANNSLKLLEKEEIILNGIMQYPGNSILLGHYADILHKEKKDYNKAEEYYLKAIETDPNNATNIGNYANFLTDIRKEHDKAEEFYLKAIQADPNNATNIGNYAIFLTDIRKEQDKAEEFYLKAIQADPNNANILGNYANFLTGIRKEHDKAEEFYLKAIQADPNNANILGNYAIFLTDIRKEQDKAEEFYLKAIQADPNDANILGNYAHFLIIAKHDFINAEAYINRAFENLPPNYAESLLAELWLYRFAHYPEWQEEAEKPLEKLIQDGITSPGWNFQAHVDLALKNKHPLPEKLQAFADALSR